MALIKGDTARLQRLALIIITCKKIPATDLHSGQSRAVHDCLQLRAGGRERKKKNGIMYSNCVVKQNLRVGREKRPDARRRSLHKNPSESARRGARGGAAHIRSAHPPSLACAAFDVAARRPRSASWFKNVTTFGPLCERKRTSCRNRHAKHELHSKNQKVQRVFCFFFL